MANKILNVKLQAAINDAVATAQYPLYKELIENWLSSYEDLWHETYLKFKLLSIEVIHGRIRCEFDRIYRHFTELLEYFEYEAVCTIAMDEYSTINANRELLAQWVLRYEYLGIESLANPRIFPGDVNYVRTIYDTIYLVPGSEFKNSTQFYEVFNHLFWTEEIVPHRVKAIIEQIAKDRSNESH